MVWVFEKKYHDFAKLVLLLRNRYAIKKLNVLWACNPISLRTMMVSIIGT